MLNAKDSAAFDQGIAMMREFYPAGLWAVYSGCKEIGFTEAQAMDLARHWLLCTIGRPSGQEG